MWERPYFQPSKSEALVHYIVFGAAPDELRVSKSKHRYGGHPAVAAAIVEPRGEAYFDPKDDAVWRRLAAGFTLAPGAQAVVSGRVEDPPDLTYLRDAVALVTALVDTGATAVLDLQALRFFTPSQWTDEVFAPDAPTLDLHIALLRSSDWLHTRGLRKFGRPDLSIANVAPEWEAAAVEVINRFASYQVQGGQVDPEREIVVEGFPRGYYAELKGDLDDPDFNNVHLAIAPR